MSNPNPTKPATIRVTIERGEAGLYYGTSRDLRGLLIAEPSPDEVRRKAPEVIASIYHASGVDEVNILTIGNDVWVAQPVAP